MNKFECVLYWRNIKPFHSMYLYICHHHHHISVMELGHLLSRSGLTYPEVSSKFCHDSFCQLENSVLLHWVVSSFSYIPVICLKLVLFLIALQLVYCFVICPSVFCCSSHVFHLCCRYSSGVPALTLKSPN